MKFDISYQFTLIWNRNVRVLTLFIDALDYGDDLIFRQNFNATIF